MTQQHGRLRSRLAIESLEQRYPFDISIGDCSGEELRRICREAIARGEAIERSQRASRKRHFVYALLAAVPASLLSGAALWLWR